jgi:cytochrome c
VDHLGKTILTVLFTVGVLLISTHAKADAAAAEATFKAKCAVCHGTGGKGKEAIPVWRHYLNPSTSPSL